VDLLTVIPDLGNWRFEYKYRLTPFQYHQVKAAIRPYMRVDPYTRRAPKRRYLVRSLYFDTTDFRAYQEKVNGDCDRTKLRIRTYSASRDETASVRVELKARKGIAMEKHNTFVDMQDYEYFIHNNHWPVNDDPVLCEFERYVHLKTLFPQVIVEYQREGFSARLEDSLRITFDHSVRSTAAETLFPTAPVFRNHNRHVIILEIKCNKSQPAWLRNMVREHGLRIAANSKFAQAVEISRPELIRPVWSA